MSFDKKFHNIVSDSLDVMGWGVALQFVLSQKVKR